MSLRVLTRVLVRNVLGNVKRNGELLDHSSTDSESSTRTIAVPVYVMHSVIGWEGRNSEVRTRADATLLLPFAPSLLPLPLLPLLCVPSDLLSGDSKSSSVIGF